MNHNLYNFICLNEGCESREFKAREYSDNNGRSTLKHGCANEFQIPIEEGKTPEADCPCCGGALKPLGMQVMVFAKTTLMTREQKMAVLRKRSHNHSRTNGELKDRKYWLDSLSGGKAVKA